MSDSLQPHGLQQPGFPVYHQLPELAQTHVHWVGDAIQPSHPLSSHSLPDFNLSQHQGLFHWASSSYQVAKILEFQLQHQSFQWIFRTDFLSNWPVWSPCSPRNSQESSPTPQFKTIQFSSAQLSLYPTYTSIHDHWKTIALTRQTFVGKLMSLLFNMLSRLVIREGNGNPLQYSCLENPRDGGAWWTAIYGIAQSKTTEVT